MRDVFEDIFQNQPIDPTEAARRSVRRSLGKRFYTQAKAGEAGPDGFPVLLDGRPVRTPGRRALALPTAALADAVAAEWEAQAEVIDPARMPLTRLANTIIDGVSEARDAVAADVKKYLSSDLLFYRAAQPEGLVALQTQYWDPVLAWAREALGARFMLSEGVVFVTQPDASVAAVRAALPDDAWRLGAMHAVMTLTGSALLALALMRGELAPEQAWTAAHVDEDWNMAQWGRDELALERRAFRWDEMQAAAKVLAHAA